jgi:hypothetical protein
LRTNKPETEAGVGWKQTENDIEETIPNITESRPFGQNQEEAYPDISPVQREDEEKGKRCKGKPFQI